MRRKREKMLGGAGRVNCYHVVSRVVNREIVFGDLEKEKFREILDKHVMGNHLILENGWVGCFISRLSD